MLDPLRFSRGTELNRDALDLVMVRRLKDQIVDDLGSRRFAKREVPPLELDLTPQEKRALEVLDQYIESRLARAAAGEHMAIRFALTILKKRLLSSPEAFHNSLQTHWQTLGEQAGAGDLQLLTRMKERAEQDWDDDEEQAQMETAVLQEATRFFTNLTEQEREWLRELIELAAKLRKATDTKAARFLVWIEDHLRDSGAWTNERLLVFTEYRDTLLFLEKLLQKQGWSDRVLVMSGSMTMADRQRVNEAFQAPPDQNPVRILLGTDAASEGLNLQKHCRYLIHYEIPWNPNRMEQRNGRIDRHGQNAEVVFCHHFVYKDHADQQFLQVVVHKVQTQRADLGAVGDVIAEEVEKAMLGLSDRIRDPADRRARVERELVRDLEVEREVRRIVEQVTQTRKDWGLYPDQMAHVLDESLRMAGNGELEPIESGELAGRAYRLSSLPASWRDLNSTLVNARGDRLAITFDNDLARDRADVTLLHLGHPLMQRAVATFRACMWEDFAGKGPRLNRCTYKVLPDRLLSGPAVVAYAGLMAVSKQGRVLHEDIVAVGANIAERKLFPIGDDSVARIVGAESQHQPIPREVGDRLRQLFPRHEEQINVRFQELEKRETERLKRALSEKAREARRATRDLIGQRIREIRKRLEQVGSQEEQRQLLLLDPDEREQYEEDVHWLNRRLEQLQDDRETEPQAAAESFTLKSVRVFPVGLLYAMPQSMVTEGR